MSERQKRNVIIISLCTVLLLMVVGYAAFNTLLNIDGTTSITSNWDIKITDITSKDIVGDASDEDSQVVDDLTANFKVNLVSPGDSITYDITVENKGNIDAEVAEIQVSDPGNEAIVFKTSGIEEGEILTANGGTDILTVKVTYSDEITKQPDNLEANLTVTLDYVEKGYKSEVPPKENITIEKLKNLVTTGGDGLYKDTYESGRYIYKGGNPNNYITFNGENAGWRIVSIETDNTIKILRNDSVTTMPFDTKNKRTAGYCSSAGSGYGCNAWAATSNYNNNASSKNGVQGNVASDSEVKTYLNGTYYSTIINNRGAIQNHSFYYGPADYQNSNLSNQIISEKKHLASSNVGLIQLSDYIRANTNSDTCGTYKLISTNYSNCKNTNWMTPSSGAYWVITTYYCGTMGLCDTYRMVANVYTIPSSGNPTTGYATWDESINPAIYLKSDIELSGSGTEDEPYTIENY